MPVCAHINWDVGHEDFTLIDILHCKLSHRGYSYSCQSKPCPACKNLLKCTMCATEFQLEAVEFPEGTDKALVLTKWLCLGRGEDPSDPQWQLQLYKPLTHTVEAVIIDETDDHEGVRAKFEAQSGRRASEESLINGTMLASGSYCTSLMYHPASDTIYQIYVANPVSLGGGEGWWSWPMLSSIIAAVLKVDMRWAGVAGILLSLVVLLVLELYRGG